MFVYMIQNGPSVCIYVHIRIYIRTCIQRVFNCAGIYLRAKLYTFKLCSQAMQRSMACAKCSLSLHNHVVHSPATD